ncbi:MAG: RidA family protein [Bacillota bacterium]|nr:RidA family protein [Bacillota bacterium]
MAKIEQRLYELGIEIPALYEPVANYLSVRKTGNLLYLSGAGPLVDGEIEYKGKIGKELNKEDGYIAARLSALNMLSILKNELGDLDRIEKIIKLQGFVACSDDFYDQPFVINGASDLFVEVFGEAGKHARAALGTNVLPFNTPVEILLIVQIREDIK